jgi:MoaA/NifB/PqqE/SkfB family radical SAM enzyme
MQIPNKNFCVLPWVSLEASPIGSVRPCCLNTRELYKNDHDKFDLNADGLRDIQNSQDLRELRSVLLNGERPVTCQRCWAEEDAGRTSKRMHTIERLKHVIPDWEWSEDAKPLMFLDLKLGNICNLKCRICGSWSSSTYAAEEIKFSNSKDKKDNYHHLMMKQGAWPRKNPAFWAEVDTIASEIRYLEFTGGEPFMIREHFDLLQQLVDRGLARQIEIHYNTNGTIYPDHAINIWKHFKHVEIAFSIDDLGHRFEYQRSGARWELVLENLKKFYRCRTNSANMSLQVCCTINVFNVLYLEDVANWISTQQFDFVYWNMLHEIWYLSIASLPDLVKTKVAETLKNAKLSAQRKEEFLRICDFMLNGQSSNGAELMNHISKLDARRAEQIAEVLPELHTLLIYATK